MIDESGANLGMVTEYGRAEGGDRLNAPRPFNRGIKFSIIGALSLLGVEAAMYVEEAVNSNIFVTFIKEMLVPKLREGMFVILDNARIHQADDVIKDIESAGAKAVFLPPYSPDLSPIEKMWSKVKEFMKRMMPRSKAEFHNALATALDSVNTEDCEEWYDACGYNV